MAYSVEIDDEFPLATKYRLEAEIMSTKQGDKTIQELYEVMNGFWNQLAKMGSIYREEEHRLIQFLLALRDEFEPLRRYMLHRSIGPSVEDAVRELKFEENRLKECSKIPKLTPKLIPLRKKKAPTIGDTGPRFSLFAEDPQGSSNKLKILSYNVLSRRDLKADERMEAIGNLIELHSPDVICFQEITYSSYLYFEHTEWWKAYHCSVSDEMARTRGYWCMQLSKLPVESFMRRPFKENSTIGNRKELCMADVKAFKGKQLIIATPHLGSPSSSSTTPSEMYSQERIANAKEALSLLKTFPNVILCGNMNWDDEVDGSFPLLHGWFDAWAELRPDESGWTYDTISNQMLSANEPPMQKRLDRFICSLSDFKLGSIEMIGKEAIPGLSCLKEKKVRGWDQSIITPVLPSEHYGLVLEVHGK